MGFAIIHDHILSLFYNKNKLLRNIYIIPHKSLFFHLKIDYFIILNFLKILCDNSKKVSSFVIINIAKYARPHAITSKMQHIKIFPTNFFITNVIGINIREYNKYFVFSYANNSISSFITFRTSLYSRKITIKTASSAEEIAVNILKVPETTKKKNKLTITTHTHNIFTLFF